MWHVLKANKKSELPKLRIYLDTETRAKVDPVTRQERHSLRLAHVIVVEQAMEGLRSPRHYDCYSVEDVWQALEAHVSQKERAMVFAHNWNFDFPIIDGFSQIRARKYDVTKWIIDAGKFILYVRRDNRTLQFVDTFNYFKNSVEELGATLGYPKLHVDFNAVSDKELMTYCRRDTEIIMRSMETLMSFWQAEDLGNFKPTLAGLSMAAYVHRFMEHPITIHDQAETQELEQASYHGARTECLYIGKVSGQKLYKLDVNSMYPYVMVTQPYPCKLRRHFRYGNLGAMIRAMYDSLVIARVNITIDVPALPMRGERLLFPVGTFDTTLTSPELEYVRAHGRINHVYEWACYEQAYLFKSFVDYFYSHRMAAKREGDAIKSWFYKILLNSLYGKFAQKLEDWRELSNVQVKGPDSVETHIFIKTAGSRQGHGPLKVLSVRRENILTMAGKSYVKVGHKVGFNSFIAISSFVTAHARMRLWELMQKAGLDNVYYVDTDSIFTNQEGLERLRDELHDIELGKLKVEKEASSLDIKTAKCYTFGSETKTKGIKKGALHVSEHVYLQPQFMKIRSLLRHGGGREVIVSQQRKELTFDYVKGDVDKKSGRVTPFRLAVAPLLTGALP